MKRHIVSALVLLGAVSAPLAQVNQIWVSRFAHPSGGWNIPTAVEIGSVGQVAVTGTSRATTGDPGIATVQYSAQGVQQWTATYQGLGNGHDAAEAMAIDSAGNVYVAGTSLGSSTDIDYVVIKYSSTGGQLWATRYDGPISSGDRARAIYVGADGSVYVTGRSASATNSGDWDIATIKLDASGAIQWASRYGHSDFRADEGVAVTADSSGNVYVTGTVDTELSGTGNSDIITIKYDSAGAQQWASQYGTTARGADLPVGIAVDGAGNVFVGGSTWTAGRHDPLVVKYSSAGAQVWAAINAGIDDDVVRAFTMDASGNTFLAAERFVDAGNQDAVLVKVDGTGAIAWVQTYDGGDGRQDSPVDLATDAAGNAYMASRSRGPGTAFDYATTRYSPTGNEDWIQRYNGPSTSSMDEAMAVAVSPGVTVVTGSSPNTGTNTDYATVKYAEAVEFGPSSATVTIGNAKSGGVANVQTSDDSYLVMKANGLGHGDPDVQVVFEATSPTISVTQMSFTLEASAGNANFIQVIELYDFVAGAYVQLDSRAATTTDSTVVVSPTNPERFMEPGTRKVRARVSWTGTGGNANIMVDLARWKITP